MWPIVWTFGDFRLGTYGVLIGIGFLICLWIARTLGTRDGLPPKAVNDLGLGVIVSGLIGCWLLGVGVNFVQGVPMDWSELRNAGAVHGGLIGGFLGLVLLVRFYRLPFVLVLDAYLPAVAFGQAMGRLGCFAAGCCFGSPTSHAWGVVYTDPVAHELGGVPLGVHLHPVQLYDFGAHLVLFGVLLWLHKRELLKGGLFGPWCIAEGVTRVSIETFRGDLGRGVWFGIEGLSTGVMTSILFVLVGAFCLWRYAQNESPTATRA